MMRFFWRALTASTLAWVIAIGVYMLTSATGTGATLETALGRTLGIATLANPLGVALTCVFVRVTAQGRGWEPMLDQRWPFAGLLTLATPVASLIVGVMFAVVSSVVSWDATMLGLLLQSALVYTLLWQYLALQFLWTLLAGALIPPQRTAMDSTATHSEYATRSEHATS